MKTTVFFFILLHLCCGCAREKSQADATKENKLITLDTNSIRVKSQPLQDSLLKALNPIYSWSLFEVSDDSTVTWYKEGKPELKQYYDEKRRLRGEEIYKYGNKGELLKLTVKDEGKKMFDRMFIRGDEDTLLIFTYDIVETSGDTNNRHFYHYNEKKQLIRIEEQAIELVTEISYYDNGLRRSERLFQEDSLSGNTRFIYDENGWLLKKLSVLHGTKLNYYWLYNKDGSIQSLREEFKGFGGKISKWLHYNYNDKGLLRRIGESEKDVEYINYEYPKQ